MNDLAARIERSRRAGLAMEEFLAPAFDVLRAEYTSRLKEVCAKEPWAANKIAALANATRIVEEVERQLAGLIVDGDVAKGERERVAKIAEMSPQRRKILGIGLPGN